MLIIAGTLSVDPSDVDRLSEAAAVMMAETHKEAGCQQYVFSVSVADPGAVQIFEVWDSAEHLEAHFATPHMAVFAEVMGSVTMTGRDLMRYEVASAEPM